MKNTIKFNKINWEDYIDPNRSELNEIVQGHNYPLTVLEDCLEPEHLPKLEKLDNGIFIIARYYDSEATFDMDTTQGLTRKIIFFISDDSLVTIHRKKPWFWDKMLLDLKEQKINSADEIAINIMYWIFDSYNLFLNESNSLLEDMENKLFEKNANMKILQKINQIKKRTSIIRHLLGNTQTIGHRLPITTNNSSIIQDMKEELDAILFRTTNVFEESNNLLNLTLSLSSHKTNETMRVLTLFSVFFMPLTFIVGVYGMNFSNMPELKHEYGYPLVWVIMILVSVLIYLWFRKKGWLK